MPLGTKYNIVKTIQEMLYGTASMHTLSDAFPKIRAYPA